MSRSEGPSERSERDQVRTGEACGGTLVGEEEALMARYSCVCIYTYTYIHTYIHIHIYIIYVYVCISRIEVQLKFLRNGLKL